MNLQPQIVRYGELRPCKTAFIDAHTPGSDQKENFTIIGGGVSESPDQHVHIQTTPGYNIGAAGQPPKCRNSLHSHRTAEVFFVLSGRWRFFWGRWGTAGEVVLEEGDIFNIPTGIFRGFENIGTDYAMIMAILGGDDAGGGVQWAPQVIEEAKDHGLILGNNGALYDTKQGQHLPGGVQPMAPLSQDVLDRMPETPVAEVLPYIARYWDLMALADQAPAKVIGAQGRIQDLPGFEVDLRSHRTPDPGPYATKVQETLMVMRGHWALNWDGGSANLAPGDTAAVPAGLIHNLRPAMSGEAAIYRVLGTEDPAGPTGLLPTG